MLKYIALMALAVTIALPATAEVTNAGAQKPSLEQMKAKNSQHYKAMQGKKAEHRAAVDKMMADCHEKIQAADTVEQMKAVKQNCRAEGKAFHEASQAKRKGHHEKMKAKHAK